MPISAVVAEELAATARELTDGLTHHLADQLATVCERAGDPPTIAVAGRVSSGKSTLVNALVGRRVAPTDAGECTRVVARFRYGRAEHVVVHTADGHQETVPFDRQGMIPADFGVPIGAVSHLEVFLSHRRLETVELVDTPGVSSTTDASRSTEAFLGFDRASRAEVARADAVIYLLTHTGRTDEAEDLAAFGAGAGGRSDAAIGVLGKADLVAGGDPDAIANLAHRLQDQLHRHVSTVLPLWTLVAESVACGRFREADAAAAGAVAALAPSDRDLLLADASLFVEHRVAVDRHARRHLQDLLGHIGTVRTVHLAASGVTGAARLTTELDRLSGRERLEAAVDSLATRADVLRASRMLADAERIGYLDAQAGSAVRDTVDRLRSSPALHVLEETVAIDDIRSGRARMPAGMADEALAVLTDPTVIGDLDSAIDRWREAETVAGDPLGARVARTVLRSLTLTRQGLR